MMMMKSNEFPQKLLELKSTLCKLEDEIKVLKYELGFVQEQDSNHSKACDQAKMVNSRLFGYRIIPGVNRVQDETNRLAIGIIKAEQIRVEAEQKKVGAIISQNKENNGNERCANPAC